MNKPQFSFNTNTASFSQNQDHLIIWNYVFQGLHKPSQKDIHLIAFQRTGILHHHQQGNWHWISEIF